MGGQKSNRKGSSSGAVAFVLVTHGGFGALLSCGQSRERAVTICSIGGKLQFPPSVLVLSGPRWREGERSHVSHKLVIKRHHVQSHSIALDSVWLKRQVTHFTVRTSSTIHMFHNVQYNSLAAMPFFLRPCVCCLLVVWLQLTNQQPGSWWLKYSPG